MDKKTRTYDARMRRWATNKNLILQRSTKRNKKDKLYGTYHLLSKESMTIIFGENGGYGKKLEEIEEFILKY